MIKAKPVYSQLQNLLGGEGEGKCTFCSHSHWTVKMSKKLYVWGRQDGELGKWAKSEELYMQKGDEDCFGAENDKKNTCKFIKWFCVSSLFLDDRALAWQFSPLFSDVYKRIQKFTTFLYAFVYYNSGTSVFSAWLSERVSTGNHHVITIIIRPGQPVPAETQHCAGTPQTPWCTGQGCTSVRFMLHTLHEHSSFSSEAII